MQFYLAGICMNPNATRPWRHLTNAVSPLYISIMILVLRSTKFYLTRTWMDLSKILDCDSYLMRHRDCMDLTTVSKHRHQ